MLFVHGVGHYRSANVIDNDFLVELGLAPRKEWIERAVGIRTRRTVLPLDYICGTRNRDPRQAEAAALVSEPDAAVAAAQVALTRAGVGLPDIGMIVAGGCAPSASAPAQACRIAAALGASVPCMDISSACSSFVVQLDALRHWREVGARFILIVTAEHLTRSVDYTNPGAAVLFGDCASAAVVSHEVESRSSVVYTFVESNPQWCDYVGIPAGGHFNQDGRAIQRIAIRKTVEALGRAGRVVSKPPLFIGHQANLNILKRVCELADIDGSRHLYNVDRFGNCGTAGAVSVLSEYWGDFKCGSEVVLSQIGAGVTIGTAVIRFR